MWEGFCLVGFEFRSTTSQTLELPHLLRGKKKTFGGGNPPLWMVFFGPAMVGGVGGNVLFLVLRRLITSWEAYR